MAIGVSKLILRHLNENDDWFTCQQLSNKLNLNILSVRSSMDRFIKSKKVTVKKEMVNHEKYIHRLYFYKIKSVETIDVFLRQKS